MNRYILSGFVFLLGITSYSQNKKQTNSKSIFIGSEASIAYYPTIDLGFGNKFLKSKNSFYAYNLAFSFHHHKFETAINPYSVYDTILITGRTSDKAVQKSISNNYRIKPSFEYGKRVFTKRNYSLDISIITGLGLNIIQFEKKEYFMLDFNGNPSGNLIHDSGIINNYSFLKNSNAFIGAKFNNYFTLKNRLIFFSLVTAYNLRLGDSSNNWAQYNGIFLEGNVGINLNN